MHRSKRLIASNQTHIKEFTITSTVNKMSGQEDRQQLREEIAQEKFDKPFDELDMSEKQAVGGTIGGRRGGQVRKEQMEAEGRTEEGKLKAYSNMGKMGAMKGGYGNELEHDPDMKEKYTGDRNYGGAAFND